MEDGGFFSAVLYSLLNKHPGIQIAAGTWVDTLSWTRSARAVLLGAVALGAVTAALGTMAAALGPVTAALGTMAAALGPVTAAGSTAATTTARSNALLQFLQLETDMPHVFHLLPVLDWRDFRPLFFGVLWARF